ncbi:PucR family transcriptional regulator [Streptomyces atratus]|uniref:PucR family transcriptional regulator n=1 Tax=Streptomyces atratus TaxID=1893 RepID=UPI00225A9FA8|nr:helix-turn-helix domain-containing protein [Streptomyces atratus]MCX5345378.1 helix-turn-helix domain-containing protein [Streptomyces atratus]
MDGQFRAFCAARASWPRAEVDSLQRAARRLPGVVHCGVRGDIAIVMVQGCAAEPVVRAVHAIGGERSAVGIGLLRPGLGGAQLSIVDAEHALRVAQLWDVPSAHFEDSWLTATLLGSRPHLEPLFADIQRVQRDHPDLAAAVLAFADCGVSLSEAAKRLQVHPNTISYRLTRWHDLTGADPRTFASLTRSVLGCRTEPR